MFEETPTRSTRPRLSQIGLAAYSSLYHSSDLNYSTINLGIAEQALTDIYQSINANADTDTEEEEVESKDRGRVKRTKKRTKAGRRKDKKKAERAKKAIKRNTSRTTRESTIGSTGSV